MKKEEKSVYVKIGQPNDVRKVMLTSAIDTASIIKYQEDYKSLRQDELKKIKELNTITRSLKILFNKLKSELPDLEEVKIKGIKKVKLKDKGKIKTELKHKVRRIDRDIDDIRRKLQSL